MAAWAILGGTPALDRSCRRRAAMLWPERSGQLDHNLFSGNAIRQFAAAGFDELDDRRFKLRPDYPTSNKKADGSRLFLLL
jgi:hypothetical protein